VIALCHVSPLSLAQLQRALPSPHTVSNASSWDALLVRMRQWMYDVLVVDPCAGDERLATVRLRDLANALGPLPPPAIVGYVSVTATSIRAVQALSRLGALEIVIRGVDDAPSALATALRRAITAHSANQLAASLGPSLAMLPPGVTEALQLMLRSPDRLRSVADLVIAAKTTRRSLDRWLARAGLAPARTLLACARANAAFHLLSAGRVGRSQAATLAGYSSARSLSRELHAIVGCSPSAIVEGLTPDAFTAALSRRLVRVAAASRG
jgi:methylphosphotriester-DNA--protein-cysteine methyltransferase